MQSVSVWSLRRNRFPCLAAPEQARHSFELAAPWFRCPSAGLAARHVGLPRARHSFGSVAPWLRRPSAELAVRHVGMSRPWRSLGPAPPRLSPLVLSAAGSDDQTARCSGVAE